MSRITASIVLYNNKIEVVNKAVSSILNNNDSIILYIIDNSPVDDLKKIAFGQRVLYIHNPSNPGFGAAHNIAIDRAIKEGSEYHFVINPDIYFDGDVITPMVNYMESNPDIGSMMPEILYPDGTIQYLPKLLPSPFWILRRKVKYPPNLYKAFVAKYELRDIDPQKVYNAPIISGCFTLLNLQAIKEIGGYDDKYFMYFEDWDLSRRITGKYRTVYFPKVSIYHEYDSGANKSWHLFKIYLKSAFHYFNKWGWIFNKGRKLINAKTLDQFN